MIKSVKQLDKFIRLNLKSNTYYIINYDTFMSGRVEVLINFKWWYTIFGNHKRKMTYLETEVNKERPIGTQITIKAI